MSFLDRVRSKPQQVKARYAFLGAVIVTGIIGAFWATTLPAKFTLETQEPTANENPSDADATDKSGIPDLLGDTKDQLGAAIDSLREQREQAVQATGSPNAVEMASTTSTSSVQTSTETNDAKREVETATTTAPKSAPRTVLIATTSRERSEQKSP